MSPRVQGTPRAARLRVALLVALSTLLSFSATNITLATFTASRSVGGNAFTTGTWVTRYYLHNNPTPPTGNTTSQFYVPMDSTQPTTGTLYNYDTNCSTNSPGRDLQRTDKGIYETRNCRIANWVTTTLVAPLAINGAARIVIWSAPRTFSTSATGNLTAGLVDYNISAGTVSLITSVGSTQANWQGGSGTWVQKTLTFPSVSYVIPVGHRLELRMTATTAASRTMWVAYDSTAYQSYLQLP